MKIEVYQCRFTKAIFLPHQRKEYIQHLKDLRAEMKATRKYDREYNAFKDWITKEKEKIHYIRDILPWLLDNQRKLMSYCNKFGHLSFGDKFYPSSDVYDNLTMDVRYDKSVSNSHVSPDGKPRNWCAQEKNLPTGYPGWEGTIQGKLKRKKDNYKYPTSEFLTFVGLKIGSGGGGNENWRSSVSIFLDDWPGLKQQIFEDESDRMVSIISKGR